MFRSSGTPRIGKISRYGKEGFEVHGRPEGSVTTVEFDIEGQSFAALMADRIASSTRAISFQITCETQEEIDYYWEKLSAGGNIQQCGWLKDKFGLSWQIYPAILPDMMRDSDKAKAARAMRAMLGMKSERPMQESDQRTTVTCEIAKRTPGNDEWHEQPLRPWALLHFRRCCRDQTMFGSCGQP
jgi:predicted 3-demethylubiquinone-9 3-methyltransferase (glyoxalase superfamily)